MNYIDCLKQREELAFFMRRLYKQKLTTCSGGNLSMRLDEKHIIITPSSLDKGFIEAENIALITIDGENLTPNLKPSIETGMHIQAYKTREDIKAIVHAHPTTATSFSAMDKKINIHLTGEAYLVLLNISYCPYVLTGTKELSLAVSNSLKESNIVIMKNHGVTTVGDTLLSAFDRMEVLEAAAQMTINTEIMKSFSPMTYENIKELDEWRNNR